VGDGENSCKYSEMRRAIRLVSSSRPLKNNLTDSAHLAPINTRLGGNALRIANSAGAYNTLHRTLHLNMAPFVSIRHGAMKILRLESGSPAQRRMCRYAPTRTTMIVQGIVTLLNQVGMAEHNFDTMLTKSSF
jgi:hypothetical protein